MRVKHPAVGFVKQTTSHGADKANCKLVSLANTHMSSFVLAANARPSLEK